MEDFLKQLWQRRVVQFGVLYLGAAWLILQVAIAIESTLQLPNWIDQSTLVLLALGFPLALILAWAQESQSPKTENAAVEKKGTSSLAAEKDKPCIAVLPFRIASGVEEERLIADGLADDITTLLNNVRDMGIIPRQSMGRTLEPDMDPADYARSLGARYAVTGSIRRAGNQLRINCDLTDIESAKQLWSEKFDRPAEDLFAIQDEIAKGIVSALGGLLARIESSKALNQQTDNLRAWELTRRAMAVAWDWRPETLHQGMLDARKALEHDPNYALAHSWLGHILAWRAAAGWSDDVVAERRESLAEADEAVRLGFDNGEALWPAIMTYWVSFCPEKSVQLYERSIARQPDIFLPFPFSFGNVGVAYAKLGQVDKGVALIKKLEDLFPNDAFGAVWARVFLGYAELCRRNYTLVADVLANTPSEHDGMCRVVALMKLGRVDEAKADFVRWKSANPEISLDHYLLYFKDYHTDHTIGEELSGALVELKTALQR